MSADVVCMSLANVPPGEQRSRFLAVGLVDNTVRIISLDPSVSVTLTFKGLPAGPGPESILLLLIIVAAHLRSLLWCFKMTDPRLLNVSLA